MNKEETKLPPMLTLPSFRKHRNETINVPPPDNTKINYLQMYEKKIKRCSSSIVSEDFAKTMLFVLAKSSDTIDDEGYSLIYDRSSHIIYRWNDQTKLWNPYSDNKTGSSRESMFNAFIKFIKDLRSVYNERYHESSDESFQYNTNSKMTVMTEIIANMKKRPFKNHVWEELLSIITVYFSGEKDRVSENVPISNGLLFNIITGQSRKRTYGNYYTRYVIIPGLSSKMSMTPLYIPKIGITRNSQ